ncbi:hypothetical protein F0L68_10670 [Solihabitans fulvus]|uniref:Uncharacterized protein n=1 Tax=Solihabitans fulvus TaxID=1892852 RepID=A0A5B2XHE0_9PSEU|nr:hypothetical protein [Solihabitans fulvus]KAA2263268.1 hypothetical protein F0L68_10670 [Solihabitans fulvus]
MSESDERGELGGESGSPVIAVGVGLPGWLLRAAVGLVAAAMVALVSEQGIGGALVVIFALLGAVAVLLPGSPAGTLLIGGVALSAGFVGDDPLRPEVLALIPLVHLLHVGCALAAVLPRDSRVHLAAFRLPARRFLVTQLAVFAIAGVAALVPGGDTSAAVEIAGLLGVGGLALLALRLTDPGDRAAR